MPKGFGSSHHVRHCQHEVRFLAPHGDASVGVLHVDIRSSQQRPDLPEHPGLIGDRQAQDLFFGDAQTQILQDLLGLCGTRNQEMDRTFPP